MVFASCIEHLSGLPYCRKIKKDLQLQVFKKAEGMDQGKILVRKRHLSSFHD
jgi:hypothetical protein